MRLLPCASALLLALTELTFAQADFHESFDDVGPTSGTGPDNLVAAGWEFRNQSEPLGVTGWYDGYLFAPYAGSGYLAVDESATSFFGGDISTWALLPAIPGQVAGDSWTLQVQGSVAPEDRLELRYAPSGGTSTGTGAGDVGDFTTLLFDVPLEEGGWSTISVPLPGAGRLALRYVAEDTCNFTCGASSLGFDELSVGPAPQPPCNAPALPASGQTVRWTRAGGPWIVCSDLLLPTGGVVIVEAGAVVSVDPGSTLTVNGEIRFEGTSVSPVVFRGATHPFGTPPIRIVGRAEVRNASIEGLLYCAHGGELSVADSNFANAGVWTANLVGGPDHDTLVELERCSVNGADVYVEDGTLVARDVTVQGAGLGVSRGYAHLQNVDVNGGPISLYRQDWAQPAYLDDLVVRNSPVGGLVLRGSDFFVGPDNTLAGNHAPIQLTGGLLGGSTVPVSGNTNNYVDALDGSVIGRATWGKIAVPYVVNGIGLGGPQRIEAGVAVEFTPGSGLLYPSGLRAKGRPDDPIRFGPHLPGQKWELMKFQAVGSTVHFENCVFEESKRALQSDNSVVFVDSSVFSSNDFAAWTNTFGIWVGRGTRFLNNLVGAHLESGQLSLRGTSNPNSFVGNATGIDGGSGNATGNWWGSASGPTHPSNPGGTGDSAAATVPVLPFRSTAPNYGDAVPQVTIVAGPGLLLEGQKTILTWEVEEDSSVSSQRILYSPTGNLSYTQIAQLGPLERSWEFTAPKGPTGQQGFSFIRIVAVDDAGQEGWDEVTFSTPYVDDVPGPPPSLSILTDLSAGFTMGDDFEVAYDYVGVPVGFQASIWLDSDSVSIDQGGFPSSLGSWDFFRAPYASTDQARVVLTVQHGNNRFFRFFSEPFEVRPHALVPDAAPQVTLISPRPNQAFAGGTAIPIEWTASDDEALREMRVQVSYTGANWHTLATLDPDQTAWSFALPSSTGIDDVGLRVIAVDRRFQNTSSEVRISIVPDASRNLRRNRTSPPRVD